MIRKLLSILCLVLLTGNVMAAGPYYSTDRVFFTGHQNWSLDFGTLDENTQYSEQYSVHSGLCATCNNASTPLVSMVVTGDAQFTVDGSACIGAINCIISPTFEASVGGDYIAQLKGCSATNGSVHGSCTAYTIKGHVYGANFTLSVADNGDGTANVTVTSTGETALIGASFEVHDYSGYYAQETILSTTCDPNGLAVGSSCLVTVKATATAAGNGYGYPQFSVYANTRQQPPLAFTMVAPRRAGSGD